MRRDATWRVPEVHGAATKWPVGTSKDRRTSLAVMMERVDESEEIRVVELPEKCSSGETEGWWAESLIGGVRADAAG